MTRRELDPRKERILRVVTDDYIKSAEPIGSRTIARKHKLGLSPATIRNEMADLEESGYLKQPYTSAGRIPSHRGYRYYVNVLMEQKELTEEELAYIESEFASKAFEHQSLLHQTVKILAQLTKYPSLILTPRLNEIKFRHIQLIPLDNTCILLLVVTDTGFIENKLVEVFVPFTPEDLNRVSAFLNSKLRGVSWSELRPTLTQLLREIRSSNRFFGQALETLLKVLPEKRQERVFVEGAINILEQPEFRQVEKVKPLMNMFEEEEKLLELMSRSLLRRGLNISIGEEIQNSDINDCSVITATYEVNGRILGTVGVLGPTRMDYARVVTVVDFVAKALSRFLSKGYKSQ